MTRRRKLLAGLLLTLLLAGVVELVCYLMWWGTEGEPFRWSRAAELRRAVAASPGGREAAARPAPNGPVAVGEVEISTQEVLHPFLGYVADRRLNPLRLHRGQRLLVGPQGFFDPVAGVGDDRPGRYRVAVFGGSVAMIFSLEGRDALARELERQGVVAEAADVEIVSRALGGYKQPQQLMTLAYALSIGERWDAAVNLDGFNEVTIAETSRGRGLYPPFPRAWDLRVQRTTDLDHLAGIGEIAYLRRRRGERAAALSASPLRLSVTVNLAWRSFDRRRVHALTAARQRLNDARAEDAAQPDLAGPWDAGATPEVAAAEMTAVWARSSFQMHAVAAAHDIPYHHFLQPSQYVAGSKPLSAEERRHGPSPDHAYRRQVELGYPALLAAGRGLRSQGVAFHDLTPLFAEVEETIYVDDCCHVNARGNQLIAAAVAAALAGDAAPLPAGGGK